MNQEERKRGRSFSEEGLAGRVEWVSGSNFQAENRLDCGGGGGAPALGPVLLHQCEASSGQTSARGPQSLRQILLTFFVNLLQTSPPKASIKPILTSTGFVFTFFILPFHANIIKK